jgi:hypothetical protein
MHSGYFFCRAFFCRRGRRLAFFLGSLPTFVDLAAGCASGGAPASEAILPAAEPMAFAALTRMLSSVFLLAVGFFGILVAVRSPLLYPAMPRPDSALSRDWDQKSFADYSRKAIEGVHESRRQRRYSEQVPE